jgi:regulator of protease activity HflC (stomatin/prohibitin superfamily)
MFMFDIMYSSTCLVVQEYERAVIFRMGEIGLNEHTWWFLTLFFDVFGFQGD